MLKKMFAMAALIGAAGATATPALAGDDSVIGALLGAGVGAVIGHSVGGDRGAVIGGAVGAVAGNLWSKRMEDKRAAMEKATQGTGIEVARTDNNELKVEVPADFSFAVGRSEIRPPMRPVLDEFARGLDPAMVVRVIGHTDSTGSDAINYPLSVARADSVRNYIAGKGVNPLRVVTEGRGSREPVASNESTAGRAQNRRVEIYLRESAPANGRP